MRRSGWLLAAALTLLALVLLAIHPALAVPPPHAHPGGRFKPTTTAGAAPTTTAAEPATTTVDPTTTTLAEPTTTALPATTTTAGAMPTTTTTTIGTCQPPITISTATTLNGGCYESTSTGTPAITINTTQQVTLNGVTIRHRGFGVADSVTGSNVTIRDCVFQQLPISAVVGHRAVELEQIGSFTFEYNRMIDGDGVWLSGPTSGAVTVRYNDAINIGRYQHPTSPNCCVQFLQLDHVTTTPIEVAWNRVTNTYGSSGVADNINFYISGGPDSANRADVHHNLIDGAYPAVGFDSGSGTGTDYVGGGILGGDGGGGHITIHDNWVVSTSNYGVGAGASAAGDVLLTNNTLVNDGTEIANNGFGQANTIQSGTGNSASGFRYNWKRGGGDSNQYPCWAFDGTSCGTGTQVALTEQDARDEWDAARVSAGVTVGPR